MAFDVSEIQRRMALTLDQSIVFPSVGGTEWNNRLSAINRAVEEWANAYDWDALRQTLYVSITGVSQASITLPGNFKKMAAYPIYYSSGVAEGETWPEIQPQEIRLQPPENHYFYVLGNRGAGFTMVWSPGTLASGASMFVQYYSFPSSLASPAELPPVPDPEYLVDRAISYILEGRSDGRFQEIEAKAREKLLQMIDNENNKSRAYVNQVKTPEALYYGFRIGRD